MWSAQVVSGLEFYQLRFWRLTRAIGSRGRYRCRCGGPAVRFETLTRIDVVSVSIITTSSKQEVLKNRASLSAHAHLQRIENSIGSLN
ncbi:hypothetical protein V5799_032123 [Amblyomma americanum]|uniref:Uncharacterized protein n=1 Tax=Amblyomma americanum TaxID=6943 RepID=A0AAQ4DS47_AMBAM